jgi:hypothetical protein
MNIEFWIFFWKLIFVLSLTIFFLMFLYVSVKGYKELKLILFKK